MSLVICTSTVLPGIAQPNDKIKKNRELHSINQSYIQIPSSAFVLLLKRPVSRAQYQWPPQPRPRHRYLPWRPEITILELNTTGYRTRRRRRPRGRGIPIRYGGHWKPTSRTFGTFWPGFDIFHCLWKHLSHMDDQCCFSHILLLNLVQARMGPATTSFLYFPVLCRPCYPPVHRWSSIGLPPLHLSRAPVWGDSSKAKPRPRKLVSTVRRTWTSRGAWGDMRTKWVDIYYVFTSSQISTPINSW